jgi:hypothetical protein
VPLIIFLRYFFRQPEKQERRMQNGVFFLFAGRCFFSSSNERKRTLHQHTEPNTAAPMSNEAGAWDPLDAEQDGDQNETEALLELQAVLGKDPANRREFINREADLTQAALRSRLGPASATRSLTESSLPWIETLSLTSGEVISAGANQELALEERLYVLRGAISRSLD